MPPKLAGDVRSMLSEQRVEATPEIASSLERQHSQALRPSDYKLRSRIQRLVGILLYFQHRRIRKLLRTVGEPFDRLGCVVVEIGAGSSLEHKHFSSSLYVSTDFVEREDIGLVVDAGHLAFRDHSVDLVICENVIEHVYESQRLLEESHRVLRKGGCLFLVTPFLFPLHDVPYDFFRYTEYSLRRLLLGYSEVNIHKILWLPLPRRLFGRFVLYYVCIAKTG